MILHESWLALAKVALPKHTGGAPVQPIRMLYLDELFEKLLLHASIPLKVSREAVCCNYVVTQSCLYSDKVSQYLVSITNYTRFTYFHYCSEFSDSLIYWYRVCNADTFLAIFSDTRCQ